MLEMRKEWRSWKGGLLTGSPDFRCGAIVYQKTNKKCSLSAEGSHEEGARLGEVMDWLPINLRRVGGLGAALAPKTPQTPAKRASG